jgi:hypothetical protein
MLMHGVLIGAGPCQRCDCHACLVECPCQGLCFPRQWPWSAIACVLSTARLLQHPLQLLVSPVQVLKNVKSCLASSNPMQTLLGLQDACTFSLFFFYRMLAHFAYVTGRHWTHWLWRLSTHATS